MKTAIWLMCCVSIGGLIGLLLCFIPVWYDGCCEISDTKYQIITRTAEQNSAVVNFVKEKLTDGKISGFEYEQILKEDAKIKLNRTLER